ncbi:glycosyltransferase [Lacisediminihabitans sp. H27-G8]|uniref:glycosyltransferase n=1 Tax=Lacisediminihabitans sp. H27-G8 TaxID=3111909 RepID=UPI0038FC9613
MGDGSGDTREVASLDATIIIPVLNGELYLERLLDMLERQDFDGSVEILVIDSGSTDRSLDIVRGHPSVRLHEIPNSEFGHGKTRNLAARLARGRLLAYLTQDAIPLDTGWLAAITAPLDPTGIDAVAVFGRQDPRPGCFPLQRYEIEAVFDRFGAGVTVYERGDREPTPVEMDLLAFYSDVNSATRRDFLLDVIPYRDLSYSEDMAFARDLIEAGYRKAYVAAAAVEHSNDLTFGEYGKRIFDETLAMRRVDASGRVYGIGDRILRAGYGILKDSLHIIRDRDFGFGERVRWLVVNPWYHVSKWRNYGRALRVRLDDWKTIDARSLEKDRVRRAR